MRRQKTVHGRRNTRLCQTFERVCVCVCVCVYIMSVLTLEWVMDRVSTQTRQPPHSYLMA